MPSSLCVFIILHSHQLPSLSRSSYKCSSIPKNTVALIILLCVCQSKQHCFIVRILFSLLFVWCSTLLSCSLYFRLCAVWLKNIAHLASSTPSILMWLFKRMTVLGNSFSEVPSKEKIRLTFYKESRLGNQARHEAIICLLLVSSTGGSSDPIARGREIVSGHRLEHCIVPVLNH